MKAFIKKLAAIFAVSALLITACACKDQSNDGNTDLNDPSDKPNTQIGDDTIMFSSPHYAMKFTEAAYLYGSVSREFYMSNAEVMSYLGFDYYTDHKDQECTIAGDGSSWYDYFSSLMTTYAKQYLVIAEAANAAGIDLTEEERSNITASLEQLDVYAEQYKMSVDEYTREAYKNNVTKQDIYNSTVLSALAGKYYNMVVDSFTFTDSEYQAYYNENFKDQTDYNMVNVRHILVDDEEEAKRILEEIVKSDDVEKAFSDAAKQYTTDPGSKETGGLYENVYKGQMVEEFENWCFEANRMVGDTGIVKTSYGYHIMYMSSFGESYFRSVADEQLRNDAFDKKYSEWLVLYPITVNEAAIELIET